MAQDLSITDLKGRGVVDTYVYGPGICAVSLESASRFIGLCRSPMATGSCFSKTTWVASDVRFVPRQTINGIRV